MRWFYRCPSCGASYEIEPRRYLCDHCAKGQERGEPIRGVLEAEWEGEPEGEESSIPFPVERAWFPPVPVGGTPLWRPQRLREELGFSHLYLKDDTLNPTGSFKDRASFLVAAFARRHRITKVSLASTGNAASSMAGIGAACGLSVVVFLPRSAPVAKRIQVLQYGAELREVDGNYDLAYEQSLEWAEEHHVMSRNTAYNPMTIEGKKSASYEIARQLAEDFGATKQGWVVPDHLFVPTGDGVILGGVYRGFENLIRLGRSDRIPTIWACQAEGSNAIARALAAGSFDDPRPSSTIADSISVDAPRNGFHALAKLVRHHGRAICVSDDEILSAQRRLASRTGLFAEPAASTAFAGFLKAASEIDRESTVILLLTGSGLKDVAAAARGVGLS